MEYQQARPLPKVCQDCQEIKDCVARGEGEWCCEECDHLGERFLPRPEDAKGKSKTPSPQ